MLRKILLLPLFRLVWTMLLGAALFWLLSKGFPDLGRASNVSLLGSARNALLTTATLALSLWLLEGRSLGDVGLRPQKALSDTTRGFLLGAGMFTLAIGILALLGSYRLLGWAPLPADTSRGQLLFRVVLMFFCVGVSEELGARGILFRLLEQGLGTWLAIAVSACFFGFGHQHNPGATTLSTVAIGLEAGVLLAAVYVATRSLWLPVGMHWAWNLFEGPVWGSPVSGNGLLTLAQASFPGPALLTGGEFGPEAGLPTVVLGTALAIAFLVVAVRRGQIVTPRWMSWLFEQRRPVRLPDELSAVAPAPVPALPPPTR